MTHIIKRVPIQIIHLAETLNTPPAICSLCTDGTVWVFHQKDSEWIQLPNIPQPENNNRKLLASEE